MNIKDLYQKYQKSNYTVCTDTRNLKQGSLFFALKGERFDGNLYAEEALQKGVAYAVVDNPKYAVNERIILVENVLETLQKLASFHRETLQIPIISITGSNGKTTTKEMIRSVLSESFDVVATQGNLNNHIGVPLTLLSIKPATDIAIVEMGANHPKEIEFLCQIATPDYGYVTNFGKAHLEGFGSLEGVIKAKSELYHYLMENNKVIFYNSADLTQKEIVSGYSKLVSFGVGEAVTYPIKTISSYPNIVLEYGEEQMISQLTGEYNISNISVAIAIGRFFKMAEKDIAQGVKKYIPSNNRSQIISQETNQIISDAYNANPSSMRVAIDNLLKIKSDKKALILGDMKELGSFSTEEHQAIADYLKSHSWEWVCLFGEEFSKVKTDFHTFTKTEDLTDFLKKNKLSNATILVKGSRAMALERFIDLL